MRLRLYPKLDRSWVSGQSVSTGGHIDYEAWLASGYKPTPTIMEAAQALFQQHNVESISRSDARKAYISRDSAHRVILTRARQGMVVFFPKRDPSDITRPTEIYDETFELLRYCGLEEL